MGMKEKKTLNSVLFHVVTCAIGLIMIYPLLWLFASSMKSNATMFKDAYSLIPEQFDLVTNYKSALAGVGGVSFWTFLGNTVIVTVVGVIGCVMVSLFAAYAFTRIKFKGSNFWFSCVMITMMIPSQVMVVPQYIVLKKLNLIDTRIALILPWFFGAAFFIFMLVQFFRGVPKELDALNMFLDPSTYNNYGGLFAMSVLSLLPTIIFFIIFQRYLVDGIAMDGIKG